jgi:hypothetical protein
MGAKIVMNQYLETMLAMDEEIRSEAMKISGKEGIAAGHDDRFVPCMQNGAVPDIHDVQ